MKVLRQAELKKTIQQVFSLSFKVSETKFSMDSVVNIFYGYQCVTLFQNYFGILHFKEQN